jgi:hypothetical protein
VVDGFALWIEDAGLESDENARFHGAPYGCEARLRQALPSVYQPSAC